MCAYFNDRPLPCAIKYCIFECFLPSLFARAVSSQVDSHFKPLVWSGQTSLPVLNVIFFSMTDEMSRVQLKLLFALLKSEAS